MGLFENMAPIGEILVEDGSVSSDQLKMALRILEPARESGQQLVKAGLLPKETLALMLEVQLLDILTGLGYVDEEGIGALSPASA